MVSAAVVVVGVLFIYLLHFFLKFGFGPFGQSLNCVVPSCNLPGNVVLVDH